MKMHPLVRALKATLPDAEFNLTSSRDWCSMTFAGQQIVIECRPLVGRCTETWESSLSEREFSITNFLVADITVASSEDVGGQRTILIEALVINL